MLSKALQWWNNGAVKSKVKESLFKTSAKDDWVYRTTALEALYAITDMLDKTDSIKNIISNIRKNKSINEITFSTSGLSTYFVIDKLNLESLELDEDYSSKYKVTRYNYDWETTSQLDRFFDEKRPDNYKWTAKYDEYKRKFFGENYFYSKEKVEPLIEIVKRCFSNNQYSYIFCKYEDSITTIKNVFEESLENDGTISKDILDKSEVIFNKFSTAIAKKDAELKAIEQRGRMAVKKSLSERLDLELEYIDKFVDVNLESFQKK